MRVRKNLLSTLFLLLLTSCSLFYSAEEKARRLAIETAVAYFTYDYEDPEDWMEPVQDEYYYQEYIENRVLPTMASYMRQYFIKSEAEFVSIEEVARGISQENSEVIIWEIVLQVNPAWPAGGPPEFERVEREEIPWAEDETAVVYGVAANRLGVWNVRLLPSESAAKVAASLQSEP